MTEENDRQLMNQNRELWNELVPIHTRSDFYGAERFVSGENKLGQLELDEVGSVEGKNLLHLQCHFGLDTLSWARLGAHVTGVDYSEKAIVAATELAARCSLDARFLCCNLYDLPQHLKGQFDVVFTSYGVLTWLPDIPRWAAIAASYVKPGGFFYIAEFHPFAMVLDDEANELRFRYSYFEKDAMRFDINGSYADASASLKSKDEYGWNHPLGEIVSSLIDNGLRIEFLHEHAFSVFKQLPFLEPAGKGLWQFPEGEKPVPLMFSLRAVKE